MTGLAADGFSALRPARQDHRLDVLLGTALHRHMGIRPVSDDDPSAGVTFAVTSALVNNSQMLHGGLVATALDVAAAYAIFPSLADEEVVLTNSLSISYLRPAPLGSVVVARADVLRRGRATAFLRSEVSIEGRTVATAQLVKAIVVLEEA
jgi:uncharacterized protein (TIGR00369 family)